MLLPEPVAIESLSAEQALAALPALCALLQDSVDGGASVGFLPPLAAEEARAYWDGLRSDVGQGSRMLLAAWSAARRLVGSAQLELATKPNARHRAEVQKVMVLRSARRQGIGRALMLELERHARRLGRTTLVLDTRQGDPSERLYRSLDWVPAGVIPRYAQGAGGALDASAFYYRLLDEARAGG